ncbi:MAG: three-Cys-motif partner protein TcmP [Acidobacteria bacterium]|nr:three-Cys-motif partner protein TcmP [Acidobacteriota bacterium]
MLDDPVLFPPKKVPTRLKHWILEGYLSSWGGIIVNSNKGEVRLCFVDTCCGSGLYLSPDAHLEGDTAAESGSALIGPQKLKELVQYAKSQARPVRARALLVNDDLGELRTAEAAIRDAGLCDVLEEVKFENSTLEQARQIVSDFTTNWFSLVFIDPFGPSPTPFAVVSEIVRRRFTDTLINFPYYSIHKWTGFLSRETAPGARARLEAIDAFMGGTEWREVARRVIATGGDLAGPLVDHYLGKLSTLGVHALALPLQFEERDRILYYLVFTSHSIAGMAAAKTRFVQARSRECQLRQEAEVARTRQPQLFDLSQVTDAKVDLGALVGHLETRFAGRTVRMDHVVLEGLRLADVIEEDVRRALTRLKKAGRVGYSDRAYADHITFKPSSAREK